MAIALISLSAVHLAYGHHPLLDGADLTIQSDERVGLIGRNGAGKSSLLRLLDGRTEPDDGAITVAGHVRVATVEQEPILDESLNRPSWANTTPTTKTGSVVRVYSPSLTNLGCHQPRWSARFQAACVSALRSSAPWQINQRSCC